jgi:hypothetical protein
LLFDSGAAKLTRRSNCGKLNVRTARFFFAPALLAAGKLWQAGWKAAGPPNIRPGDSHPARNRENW